MTLLLTVREARERHDPPLTQEQLAAASGVDQTYISLIERCLRNPSNDIKLRLAEALGIAPSDLRFSGPQPETTVDPSVDSRGHTDTPEDLAAEGAADVVGAMAHASESDRRFDAGLREYAREGWAK